MLYLVGCFLPFCLGLFFLKFSSFTLNMFFCFFISTASLCLYPCICSAMSPILCRMGVYSECPGGPSGSVSLFTCIRCYRCVPCVSYVCLPVLVDSWILSHSWIGLNFRLTSHEDWPHSQYISYHAVADPMEHDSPQQSLMPAKTTLWVCHLLG